ncbi:MULTISPECIES: ABC transporter ATP-binding protein [unclassified Streptomyces]|uniref:ABC transporter ATP-binding protein n=1 Tax=unclassified Streptomyces TaxID=2593676 RepID=UPI002E2A7BEF|nr:ATP-binding cassette domain-containing protein [Streptomyces sp. NBC_00223]
MIQAIGLTSTPRRNARPTVRDLSFDIREGEVTGLLGPAGSGKTTALRLLLGVESGRGATLVDGRPLHELPDPVREIGALVGDVPGHPRRSARGHLRMLCAAFGVPVSRADEVLALVGLDEVADQRLGSYSLGMDRRLGFAVALLARPRALILDDPARGLPPREAAWVHDLVRRHAAEGGAVLLAGRDARALARTADHVIALDKGRLVADQAASDFARGRLRPYVAVRSPYAQRLAELLSDGGAEVVAESGSRIAVYGSSSAAVGETAYRHGILLHELADTAPAGGGAEASGDDPAGAEPRRVFIGRAPRRAGHRPGPVRPVGYEVRRAFGVRTPWPTVAVALVGSVLGALLLARTGATAASPMRLISGWAAELPLPAAAIGAGGLGALSYGQEFRYPALAPGYGPEPRSPRLLAAKLVVGAVAALLLAGLAAAVDVEVLRLTAGPARTPDPLAHPAALAAGAALAVGCAWAGVLAAATFRTTALGLSAVLAVPLLVAPAVRTLIGGHATRELGDAGGALWSVVSGASQGGGGTVARMLRLAGQPFFVALALSLAALAGACAAGALLGRWRGRRSTAVQTGPTAQLSGKKG